MALSGLVWLLWLIDMDAFHRMLRSAASIAGASVSFLPISTNGETAATAFAPARFLESNLFSRHPVETLLSSVAFFRCIGQEAVELADYVTYSFLKSITPDAAAVDSCTVLRGRTNKSAGYQRTLIIVRLEW